MPRPSPLVVALLCALSPLVAVSTPAAAQQPALGPFEGQADVGAVRRPGAAAYDAARQRLTVSGSGANMWDTADAFHFVWKRMTGDFILTTRAAFVGAGVDPHRKLGWIVRASLDAGSPHVVGAVHGDGLAALQYRRAPRATTEEVRSPVRAPDVVQLERRGGRYTASFARFGDTLSGVELENSALGDTVYVGLFVCAHDDSVVERATFADVRVTVPAREGFVPYRDYIGGNLETVDAATGARTMLRESAEAVQAPNWTADGRALIYNLDGRLYRFDLASRDATLIDTGFATANNNDHVLSFDGRTLGISHHSREDGGKSVVYTVPLGGGTPRRATRLAPSYLHGWSPDGRHLVYTGERNGVYDIYRVPAGGGEETRLTSAAGLDDGPEYSPDGRYIYFNSSRGGKMQIWRMRADGSGQEPVTRDGYNNWFPHVSPDGKSIAFLSFPASVEPTDHPWYKPVYIRVMPAAGGPARVLAYVYGGQGTINVPSWSPDSRRLAFVSNSDRRR